MKRRNFVTGAAAGVAAVGAYSVIRRMPDARRQDNLARTINRRTSLNRHEAERAALTLQQLNEV